MELQTIEIWIMFLTLILAPVIYSIRENSHENKRIDVLLNKTREEVARDYVTKEDLEPRLDSVVRWLIKFDGKVDK